MLSNKAQKIFNLKYRVREDETWEQACWRISSYISSVEEIDQEEWAKKFFQLIYNKVFIPGGRILKNAGTDTRNLFNCFFLNVDDSRESIYDTLKNAAEIFAWGGGLGIKVSNLREEGALIKSTNTKSSGPLSFMELFNLTGDVIQQASRRAAEIALMNISHPDIQKFIHAKASPSIQTRRIVDEFSNYSNDDYLLEKLLVDRQLNHFNISVEITDEFMEAVENDDDWNLISPSTNEIVKTVKAKDLFREIATEAWKSGDPGVFFIDAVQKDNMVDYLGFEIGTNPCAEITLLDGEPCCLGSLNLMAFYDEETNNINLEFLEFAVRTAVRFLDNVHDLSYNRVDKINAMSENLRRIGLGVMGFADLLAEMEIPYNSKEGRSVARRLSWIISFFAWLESFNLAEERGEFYWYEDEEANKNVIKKVFTSPYLQEQFDLDKLKPRNVSVTAIAPTGTISLLADVNSAIEPFFALAYRRFITEGESYIPKDTIVELNPILFKKLKKYGLSEEEIEVIKLKVLETGSIQDIENIPHSLKAVFRNAHEISPEDHIAMQAVWQEYISNSISKTINLPNDYDIEDIEEIYMQMWKAGLKSSTIYRDGSKSFQILNVGKN